MMILLSGEIAFSLWHERCYLNCDSENIIWNGWSLHDDADFPACRQHRIILCEMTASENNMSNITESCSIILLPRCHKAASVCVAEVRCERERERVKTRDISCRPSLSLAHTHATLLHVFSRSVYLPSSKSSLSGWHPSGPRLLLWSLCLLDTRHGGMVVR